MDEINIAFAVDNTCLDQVAVVIASILASGAAPSALQFFIVLDGSAEVARQKLAAWTVRPPHLTLVPADNPFTPRTRAYISSAALLRTQLPELLPALDRVLYLDADIVVRRDVAELYRSELGGQPVGGVADLGFYMMMRREQIRRETRLRDYFARLGIDPRRSLYVNSGVLLMNLAALRWLDFSARALAFSNARGAELITMDQCLINTLLSGHIAELDARWNACGHMIRQPRHHHYLARRFQRGLALQQAEPWLIHYTGPDKPWNSAAVWRGDDWWQHATNTGIAWAPAPGAAAPRVASRTMSAWRSVTSGLSHALSRLYPD